MVRSGNEADGDAIRGLSDAELVQRLQQGDERALVELYSRFSGLVYSVAYRVLHDHALAEEVMQDAFLNCWKRADSYRPAAGNVAPWLARIARNRAIDVTRGRQHQARLREQAPIIPLRTMSSRDHSEQIALGATLSEAVAELPDAQRAVVELAYFDGLTQTEIAARLDQPLGTVKSRTRTAMEHLRTRLRSTFGSPSPEAATDE